VPILGQHRPVERRDVRWIRRTPEDDLRALSLRVRAGAARCHPLAGWDSAP
jgi:hypothetical protein